MKWAHEENFNNIEEIKWLYGDAKIVTNVDSISI
jgi:hypothetical protein